MATEDVRPSEDDLAYIRYSAKELLFAQAQTISTMQNDIHNIRLQMVTRQELQSARRWAISASIAAGGSLVAVLRAIGF